MTYFVRVNTIIIDPKDYPAPLILFEKVKGVGFVVFNATNSVLKNTTDPINTFTTPEVNTTSDTFTGSTTNPIFPVFTVPLETQQPANVTDSSATTAIFPITSNTIETSTTAKPLKPFRTGDLVVYLIKWKSLNEVQLVERAITNSWLKVNTKFTKDTLSVVLKTSEKALGKYGYVRIDF